MFLRREVAIIVFMFMFLCELACMSEEYYFFLGRRWLGVGNGDVGVEVFLGFLWILLGDFGVGKF